MLCKTCDKNYRMQGYNKCPVCLIAELQERLTVANNRIVKAIDDYDFIYKALQNSKDVIHRRNLQIAELKKDKQNALHSNNELHARINLLEDIVKRSGMWDYYCDGCFEYHKGNKEDYLKRCPKIV